MHRGRPRTKAMITVRIIPAASHGARPASATTLLNTTEKSNPPDPVSALTSTNAAKNSSGGLTTTVSRPGGAAYHAARTHPATKARPASTLQPSQVAASRPTKKHPAMVSTAPRSVSRGARPAACPGALPGGGAIGGRPGRADRPAACPGALLGGGAVRERPGRAAEPVARAGALLGSGAIGVYREQFGRWAGQVQVGRGRRSPLRGCRFQGGRFQGGRFQGGRFQGGRFLRGRSRCGRGNRRSSQFGGGQHSCGLFHDARGLLVHIDQS